MSRLLSRRTLIGVGGASVLAPVVAGRRVAAAGLPGGPLVTLLPPVRVFDSRVDTIPLAGQKLGPGMSVGVTVSVTEDGNHPESVFVNCTVTQTEGRGHLVIRASDPTGEEPLPDTSNINWFGANQTLANLTLTAVGDENGIEVHNAGPGKAHVIIDVQGYVPVPIP